MRPVSDAFLSTVRGSHVAFSRAYVGSARLPIIDGDVTLDGDADVRGTVSITVDGSAWPADPFDLVTPYGTELTIEAGVRLGHDSREILGLGVYRVEDMSQESPGASVTINLSDRNAGLRDARLVAPRTWPAGTPRATVTAALVRDVYPAASITWDSDPGKLGAAMTVERDRLPALIDLWASVGRVGAWNHRGELVIGAPPAGSSVAWRVNAGENGVLVAMPRSLTRDGIVNAIVATGETTDDAPPVAGVAYDLAADSPTRWGGRFGKVPGFYASPLLTTVTQCQKAAATKLANRAGLPYTVEFTSAPNAALEPYDVVELAYPRRPRDPAMIVERHRITAIKIPLGTGPITCSTRQLTEPAIGTSDELE